MRVASFFAGIGGFELGFERAGFEVVFQCEMNPFCQRVLKKHWPHVPLIADINDVEPRHVPRAELWCGGFPCQDLSLANQGKRKGLEGARSGLFYRFADLVEQQNVRPKWLVLENVVGLLNSHDGEDFRAVLSTLDELGYFVAWRVLDAKYFGSPQRRRRTFVVASHQSDSAARVLFGTGAVTEVAGPKRLPGHTLPVDLRKAIETQISTLSSTLPSDERIRRDLKRRDTGRMVKPTRSTPEEAQTLFARRMLASEYETLQGFPPNWTDVDSELSETPSTST